MFHQPIQFVHIFLLCDGKGGLRLNRQRREIEDRKERKILADTVGEESGEKSKIKRINKTARQR